VHTLTIGDGAILVNSIAAQGVLQGNIDSIPEFSNDQVIALLQKIDDVLNKKEKHQLVLTIDYNKIPVKAVKDSALIQA
ncbi:ArgE/DapE family deacylase, partial [Enterococcus faecalis]